MYSLVYYNNYKNNKIKIDQLVIKNSTDLICTLCFEEIMTNENIINGHLLKKFKWLLMNLVKNTDQIYFY